jgi:hypothetical protein
MDSAAAAELTKPADVRAARLETVPPLPLGARQNPVAVPANAFIRGGTIGLLALVQLSWLAVIAFAVFAAIR